MQVQNYLVIRVEYSMGRLHFRHGIRCSVPFWNLILRYTILMLVCACCSVGKNGRVRLAVLGRNWSPVLNLRSVLRSTINMLEHP